MRDFTIKKEDKKYYVTNIDKIDDKYLILYADNHKEIKPNLSEHNYQFYLNKMEQQYLNYKDEYLNKKSREVFKLYIQTITIFITQIISIILLYNIDINIIEKLIIGFIYLFVTVAINFYKKIQIIEYDQNFGNMEAVDYFLNHKDEFTYTTKDNKIKYIINSNTIDIFTSKESLISFTNNYKKDIGIKLTKRMGD